MTRRKLLRASQNITSLDLFHFLCTLISLIFRTDFLSRFLKRKSPRVPASTMEGPLHAKPKLSRLESLPTELLEQIFLQSLNIDLPLASPHLTTMLSSIHMKTTLVLKVFSTEDVYDDHGVIFSRRYRAGSSQPAIGELQSRILKCRWMT